MKAGDLVKHKYGTLQGTGIIVSAKPEPRGVSALWADGNQPKVYELSCRFLEVVGYA